jgi:acyl-CoA-binding protein
MSEIEQDFQAAVAASKNLPRRPDNETMLKLYALYKQGTEGDAPAEAPGDMMGMFKHKAWAEVAGTARNSAQQQYIDLVNALRASMA